MQAILVPIVVVLTAYQPVPAQTKPECKDRHNCETSINDGITMFGVAASQDLLKSKRVKYGDAIYIPGYGIRIVNDAMGETKCVARVNHKCVKRVPIKNALDMLVFTHDEEKRVGETRTLVFKMEVTK